MQGTRVYGPDGQRIGSIERVMIEKIGGRVSYAVLSFGGFFGIGDDYYPLPWPSLKYNVEIDGYQTMITKDQLRKRRDMREASTGIGTINSSPAA